MATLTYIGVNELDEVSKLKTLCEKEAEKIDYLLKDAEIKVHVKVLNPDGNVQAYDIKLRAESDKGSFEVKPKREDWDMARTIHKAFSELSNLIKHKLHLK